VEFDRSLRSSGALGCEGQVNHLFKHPSTLDRIRN
jgi:hypothetical protein